jgi:hypothetical protein
MAGLITLRCSAIQSAKSSRKALDLLIDQRFRSNSVDVLRGNQDIDLIQHAAHAKRFNF